MVQDMAIDPDAIREDIVTAPKRVTNAAGETVENFTPSERLAALEEATSSKPKRPPFATTRTIAPAAVGPRGN